MNIVTVIAFFRGLALLNNKKKYDANAETPRPAWLSRRMIHGTIFAIASIVGMVAGFDVPSDGVSMATDQVGALVDVFVNNKEAFVQVGALFGVVVGFFKREK